MKLLAAFLLISTCCFAQKMHVKVLTHTVDGKSFTRIVPGIGFGNGSANANCGAFGSSVNCSGTASGSSVYLPAHSQEITLAHIQMLLQLPDGRRAGVYCNDHGVGLTKERIHTCKNPVVDELEADFSGDKVKLTWGVGLDSKKKESETYMVGPVYPVATDGPKP